MLQGHFSEAARKAHVLADDEHRLKRHKLTPAEGLVAVHDEVLVEQHSPDTESPFIEHRRAYLAGVREELRAIMSDQGATPPVLDLSMRKWTKDGNANYEGAFWTLAGFAPTSAVKKSTVS